MDALQPTLTYYHDFCDPPPRSASPAVNFACQASITHSDLLMASEGTEGDCDQVRCYVPAGPLRPAMNHAPSLDGSPGPFPCNSAAQMCNFFAFQINLLFRLMPCCPRGFFYLRSVTYFLEHKFGGYIHMWSGFSFPFPSKMENTVRSL